MKFFSLSLSSNIEGFSFLLKYFLADRHMFFQCSLGKSSSASFRTLVLFLFNITIFVGKLFLTSCNCYPVIHIISIIYTNIFYLLLLIIIIVIELFSIFLILHSLFFVILYTLFFIILNILLLLNVGIFFLFWRNFIFYWLLNFFLILLVFVHFFLFWRNFIFYWLLNFFLIILFVFVHVAILQFLFRFFIIWGRNFRIAIVRWVIILIIMIEVLKIVIGFYFLGLCILFTCLSLGILTTFLILRFY